MLRCAVSRSCFFFFNDTATTEIYTLLTHSFPTRRSSDLSRELCSLPCEGRGGFGRGVFRTSASRDHPLPASPCLRRGRGQSGSAQARLPRSDAGRPPYAACCPAAGTVRPIRAPTRGRRPQRGSPAPPCTPAPDGGAITAPLARSGKTA